MAFTPSSLLGVLTCAVALALGVTACSGSAKVALHDCDGGACHDSGPQAMFPYSGPSCNGPSFSNACYGCAESACGGTVGCLDRDCSDFFSCFCACAVGDSTCAAGCQQSHFSPACQTCVESITACEQKACNPQCMTGNPETSCSSMGRSCANGMTLEACSVTLGGLCQSQYYTVGSQTFTCAACGDCTAAGMAASAACP